MLELWTLYGNSTEHCKVYPTESRAHTAGLPHREQGTHCRLATQRAGHTLQVSHTESRAHTAGGLCFSLDPKADQEISLAALPSIVRIGRKS